MNSPSDENSAVSSISSSFQELESDLLVYLTNGALLMYWHLQQGRMMYFTGEDKRLYKAEMRMIRDKVNEGIFLGVKKGDNLTIGGRRLYTILVEIEDMCPAYFILRRRGLSDDFYYLPYLFVDENTRNHVFNWIGQNTSSIRNMAL